MPLSNQNQDRKITYIGGLILASLTVVTGIITYIVMERQAELLLTNNLETSLQNKVTIFESRISHEQAESHPELIIFQDILIDTLKEHNNKPGNTQTHSTLQQIAKSFINDVYLAISIKDNQDKELARAGKFSSGILLRVPLNTQQPSFLMWDNQFILSTDIVISENGQRIGSIVTEVRMQQLTHAFTKLSVIGETAEFAICALSIKSERAINCFLNGMGGVALYTDHPRQVNNQPLPISYALDGETGIVFTQDYRKELVAAAYAPVGSLGLGMVLKVDQSELYSPIYNSINIIIPILFSLVVLALLLLRWLISPLVRNLINSEQAAHHANIKLLNNEAALQASELRFLQIADAIEEVFWLSTPDWSKFFYVSPAYEQEWGQSAEALYADHRLWIELIHPDDQQHVIEDLPDDFKSIKDQINIREYRIKKQDGEVIWIKTTAFPIYDTEGNVIRMAGIARNITDRKKAEEQILYQAHYDTLTTLPNRFLSLDRLTQLLSKAKRTHEIIAILFLDLDDFKKINDTLGHETGDKLLVKVAARLNEVVRKSDTVGRLGGDEFIILLSGLANAAEIRPFAEHLLARFRGVYNINDRELALTASLGIAVFPEDGEDPSELLRNADSAMYHAKKLGRNTYSYFTNDMNRDVSRQFALEEQMHNALERDEFEVVYQPKFDLNSGVIIGAEALLRWHNPVLGHISPIEFIPIAEQTGLIVGIGKFVLTRALQETKQWKQKFNAGFCIAVNLSPLQFRDLELVPFIEQEIKKSQITTQYLELEITEGVLMTGHSYINDSFKSLTDLGVSIAMDDFGTGYSSLSYLRNYPFNVLKIDRSFVNDITFDEADRELTHAAIAMAHSLKLKVVAEGIETKEQLTILKSMGCDYGQGYLFSKPVSAIEITNMLRSENSKKSTDKTGIPS